MIRSAELRFGTVFCIRRAAIAPKRSSALQSHGSNASENRMEALHE
jgi:hypothetical protein